MSDPNLEDFYRRIARLQSAHSRGLGFEAKGTLGRSAYAKPRGRRFSVLRPLIVTMIAVIGLKALIFYHIGAETYGERVAVLSAGTGFDRVGGFLMQPDPATLWVAAQMAEYLPRFF